MIPSSTVSIVIRSSLSIIDWEMLHIAKLRQEMAAIANSPVPVGNASILYRETHGGGDYLEISPLDTLEREWEILSAGMKPSLRLVPTFVRQFRELLPSPEAKPTTHLFHRWASNKVRVLSIAIKVVSHRSAMTRKAVPCDCPFPLHLVSYVRLRSSHIVLTRDQ